MKNTMPKSDINVALRSLRIHFNLTQTEFAKKLGFSEPYINKVEKGTVSPSRRLLSAVESTFDVQIQYEESIDLNGSSLYSVSFLSDGETLHLINREKDALSSLPDISQRIFLRLMEIEMTQIEFAKLLGISTSTISMWRKNGGQPSAHLIMPICEALGVSSHYLLTGQEVECPLAKAMNLNAPPCIKNSIAEKSCQDTADPHG